MKHILDNVTWNALNTGNRDLSLGNENVRFFHKEVSPFVGMPEITNENFNTLHAYCKATRRFNLFIGKEILIPDDWKIIRKSNIWQMVCNREIGKFSPQNTIQPLTQNHVEEMVTLTQQTHPGPFEKETILFGHYEGIFEHNKLIAMAGQRMFPQPYAEISAVCTDPDFRGRGLAADLIQSQIHRMQSVAVTPFLHVLTENIAAIKLYEKLGFEKRKEFIVYTIEPVL